MNELPVSVTCTNCGCPVVFHIQYETAGGISECCHNCGGLVTASYDCDYAGRVRIRYVRTMGGLKK